jgi:signal transduction histidine kinase
LHEFFGIGGAVKMAAADHLSMTRLLVVDDEMRQMEALCRTLTPEGYEVTWCATPYEALAALREQPFDVLLTDLMMPEMDGIALVGAALEIDPDLVAIMMTGHGTVSTAVEAMKVGALDYILKPFNLTAIRPVLARAVDVRRLRLDNIRLREAMGIYEVSTALGRSRDAATVLELVADAAFQQSRAQEVRVYVAGPAGADLRLVAARSRAEPPPLGSAVPITEPLRGWALRKRQWLATLAEARPDRPAPPDADARPSRLSIPMFAGERFAGLLTFDAARPYRPVPTGQIKALSVLANAGATALEVSTLLEHLRRTNDGLRKFAWAASHDLQEPLREVALSTEQLARRCAALDGASTALAASAAHGARRILQMVQELRTFVDAGEVHAEPGVVADGGAAWRQAVASLEPAIVACGARISDGTLPSVRMRERHLAEVFQRLLDNALKFRRPGSAPRIEVSATAGGGEWTFSVRDDGIGIPAAFQTQVFELFQRLNRREEYDGNGMGLPVCRRLIEAYGGRLWVESSDGGGARFCFAVPGVSSSVPV